jgi:hypothetical protein
MKLFCTLALIIASAWAAAGQQAATVEKVSGDSSRQVADNPAAYFGPFRINGDKPEGFENFDFFILGYKKQSDADSDNRDALLPTRQGDISVRGQVETVKGNLLDFESVRLVESGPVTEFLSRNLPPRFVRAQPITLSFSTVEKNGFRYVFRGAYLDEPAEENRGYTCLRGVLSKFKGGKLLAEGQVAFSRFAYEELNARGQ